MSQRHIARKHQRDAVVSQQRHSLLHRMACAQLRLLTCKLHVKSAYNPLKLCASSFYFNSAMTCDDDRTTR